MKILKKILFLSLTAMTLSTVGGSSLLFAEDCVAKHNTQETASSYISKCRKGSIRSVFPGEMMSSSKASLGMTTPSDANHATLYKVPEETPSAPYLYNLYTSNNYVLHKGQCNESDNSDSRSAIGVKDGKMLFVSSNHDYYLTGTSTTELCEIFKAFGYENAILNDGGASSSMYVNGILVNPLMGPSRVAFGGASRQILYSITAKVSK